MLGGTGGGVTEKVEQAFAGAKEAVSEAWHKIAPSSETRH